METNELNFKEETGASFVDSLTYLIENSSALEIRLLASKEYCNYTENDMKILNTKMRLLSEAKENATKTRDELLTRNRTNIINLDGLFNVQYEFHNYKCDVKDGYIRTEEEMKNKRTQYDKIITSYKTKWEAVELEYEKSPMATELCILEKENILCDAEAKRLEDLFRKTKADYLELCKEWWSNLLAKILDLAIEYQRHTEFAKVTDEIGQKNITLQELFHKLQTCEAPKVTGQYSDYFKPTPLVISIPANRKVKDTSKISLDLTTFDEISIPQENLEMETEDEQFFHSCENGKSFEFNRKPQSDFARENVDSTRQPVENVAPAAFTHDYCNKNSDDKDVTEHGTRASDNNLKDTNEAFDEDASHVSSEPDFMSVKDKRLQTNNEFRTNDVDVVTQIYTKSAQSELEGVKSVKIIPREKIGSFKLKERKKETSNIVQDEGGEYGGSAPKKVKYSFNTKPISDSPQICPTEGAALSDNHMLFDFDFGDCRENSSPAKSQPKLAEAISKMKIKKKPKYSQERVTKMDTHEENQEENSPFLFFLKADSNREESASIFNLF